MRLIDLDKMMAIYDEDNNAVIFGKLDTAAVEAIPIEWIRNEMDKAMEPNRYRDYDLIYTACVLQLLEHWRKENETN